MAVIAVFAGLCPLLLIHFSQLWIRPHYQFFPLAILGACVIAFERLKDIPARGPCSSWVSYSIVAAGWVVLLAGEVLYSSWLASVSLLITSLGIAHAVGGWLWLKRVLPAVLLLGLIVPPPFEGDRGLILALQRLTTMWSSRFLDMLGVYHLIDGNVVVVGGRKLLVEEACSGVNSLFSVLACSLFWVFFMRRGPLHGFLMAAAAVGWVLLANVLRITLITYLVSVHDIDLTSGLRHEAVGWVFFGLAIALALNTDSLLGFLLSPARQPLTPITESTDGEPAGDDKRLNLAPVGLAFAALGILHLVVYTSRGGASTNGDALPPPEFRPELMPQQYPADPKGDGGAGRPQFALKAEEAFFERERDDGSDFGERSAMWIYTTASGKQAVVSVDYPFPGWHDLSRCYTGQGWAVEGETVHRDSGDGTGPGFVEMSLGKPAYRSGFLLFAQLDRDGTVLAARGSGASLSSRRQLQALSRWRGLFNGDPEPTAEVSGPVYQVQLFVESVNPLSDLEKHQATRFFLSCLETVSRQMTASGQPK